MKVLTCPDCSAVMHTVEVITEHTVRAGIDQLSRHSFETHVLPRLESMLEFTSAQLQINPELNDIDDLWDATRVTCPGCDKHLTEDTVFYVCSAGRTLNCCSLDCARALA